MARETTSDLLVEAVRDEGVVLGVGMGNPALLESPAQQLSMDYSAAPLTRFYELLGITQGEVGEHFEVLARQGVTLFVSRALGVTIDVSTLPKGDNRQVLNHLEHVLPEDIGVSLIEREEIPGHAFYLVEQSSTVPGPSRRVTCARYDDVTGSLTEYLNNR